MTGYMVTSYVQWPNIDCDIEELVRTCMPYQSIQKHTDFVGAFIDKYFLLEVIAFSKWPVIIHMTSMVASKTICVLRRILFRFGLPVILVRDNGPTFKFLEFANFLKSNGIQHKQSATYRPEINSQVETYVQTMKNLLRKLTVTRYGLNNKLINFLILYRRIRNSTTGFVTCQTFFRTTIYRYILDELSSTTDFVISECPFWNCLTSLIITTIV